jgi:hypothetical protein
MRIAKGIILYEVFFKEKISIIYSKIFENCHKYCFNCFNFLLLKKDKFIKKI